MKIYLNVPYSEKDTAKALGAKWDQLKRCWYFIEDEVLNPEDFNDWLRETNDIPEDKVYRPIPINLNGQKYFCIEDAMELFNRMSAAKLHNTNLGQILVRLKIKRLGYRANGSSGYPADKWNEIWDALNKFENKKRKLGVFQFNPPSPPLCQEPLYKSKPFSSYLSNSQLTNDSSIHQ